MGRLCSVTALGAIVAAAAVVSGCSESQPPQEPAASSTVERVASMEDNVQNAEIEKELEKLSPEDRKLVLAQKICPVSGEPLGSMGPPLKVTVDGKSFFICCEGCREEAEKNFAEHLAKVQTSTDADTAQ
jgi:entry exclusion lipoprotein TrbK